MASVHAWPQVLNLSSADQGRKVGPLIVPPRPIIVLARTPQGSFQVAAKTAAMLRILSENLYTLGISFGFDYFPV